MLNWNTDRSARAPHKGKSKMVVVSEVVIVLWENKLTKQANRDDS